MEVFSETELDLLDDLPHRIQRRFGLMRKDSQVAHRALAVALLTWLPLVLSAWIFEGGTLGASHQRLETQFPAHVRCLVAMPLFVLSAMTARAAFARATRQLLSSRLLDASELRVALAPVARLRDAKLPWAVVLALVAVWTAEAPVVHELRMSSTRGLVELSELGVGTLWYLFFVLPLFNAMLLGWGWRIMLYGYAVLRVARAPLALVPTHPDGAFGVGFLSRLPLAFAPCLFGASSVVNATWVYEILYQQVPPSELVAPALVFVSIMSALVVAPLLAFAVPLGREKLTTLPEYAALVAEHGRKVRMRWIDKREPNDPAMLDAPELGPVADTLTLFDAVAKARIVPVTKQTLVMLGVPLGLPFVALVLCQVPIGELLTTVLHALT